MDLVNEMSYWTYTLTGISFPWYTSFGSKFSSSFNVWSKDEYSKWTPSFDMLPLIAFKLRWFLYFEIAASTGSNRF